MNPYWIKVISQTMKTATRKCPHCDRNGVYPLKKQGQFYTCKHCHHRFQEKKK